MPILATDLAQSTSQISLTSVSNIGNQGTMKMSKIHFNDSQPLMVKLSNGLDSEIPFEPSVYGGSPNGDEVRKTILLRVSDEIHEAFAALEEHCRTELEADSTPNVRQLWTSSIRSDQYGKSMRCKINMSGDRSCDFWNSDNDLTKAPPLKGLPVNAVIHVRGV